MAGTNILMTSRLISTLQVRDGEKAGRWPQALWLLHDMCDRRLKPDTISYSAAVSACMYSVGKSI